MWVAILVGIVASGQLHSEISDKVQRTAAECEQYKAKLEQVIDDDGKLIAYAVKCVEITKADVKAGGKKV